MSLRKSSVSIKQRVSNRAQKKTPQKTEGPDAESPSLPLSPQSVSEQTSPTLTSPTSGQQRRKRSLTEYEALSLLIRMHRLRHHYRSRPAKPGSPPGNAKAGAPMLHPALMDAIWPGQLGGPPKQDGSGGPAQGPR